MQHNGNNHDPDNVHMFVDEYIDSLISWDILLYFHRNSSAVETPASLANRLGRNQSDVEAEIDKLVKKDVLTRADGGTFRHAPAPELSSRIQAFSDALTVASSRMTILSQVLGKRRS